MNGDREICLAAGMDAFVTKPIKPKELFALLQEVALSRPSSEDLG
jgi:CheY-like chemotaxis protein